MNKGALCAAIVAFSVLPVSVAAQDVDSSASDSASVIPPPSALRQLTIKRLYFGPGGTNMAGVQVNTNNPIRDQFRTMQGRWIRIDRTTAGQGLLCASGQWAWIAEFGDDGPRTYFTIVCAGHGN